jgi:hypothetical protein
MQHVCTGMAVAVLQLFIYLVQCTPLGETILAAFMSLAQCTPLQQHLLCHQSNNCATVQAYTGPSHKHHSTSPADASHLKHLHLSQLHGLSTCILNARHTNAMDSPLHAPQQPQLPRAEFSYARFAVAIQWQ